MAILDLFSIRNKQPPDVFIYDELPRPLRNQIVHILEAAIGPVFQLDNGADGWRAIAMGIAREHGILEIPETARSRYDRDWFTDCMNYFLQAEPERALDVVELAIRIADQVLRKQPWHQHDHQDPDGAIQELNQRFLVSGCGYQYENDQIVRVDSKLLHAEVVRPALALLADKGFDGANNEFLTAHQHLRHGRDEDAISWACKAFESTLKVICNARKWQYDKTKATAKDLIKIVLEKGLVPTYSQEQLETLTKLLLGGTTVRNKDSGHGAGAKPRQIPSGLAAYALHLAASNIVFVVERHKAKR